MSSWALNLTTSDPLDRIPNLKNNILSFQEFYMLTVEKNNLHLFLLQRSLIATIQTAKSRSKSSEQKIILEKASTFLVYRLTHSIYWVGNLMKGILRKITYRRLQPRLIWPKMQHSLPDLVFCLYNLAIQWLHRIALAKHQDCRFSLQDSYSSQIFQVEAFLIWKMNIINARLLNIHNNRK